MRIDIDSSEIEDRLDKLEKLVAYLVKTGCSTADGYMQKQHSDKCMDNLRVTILNRGRYFTNSMYDCMCDAKLINEIIERPLPVLDEKDIEKLDKQHRKGKGKKSG